jgi:probable rRNA maturation factor
MLSSKKKSLLPFEIDVAVNFESDAWRPLVKDLEPCSSRIVDAVLTRVCDFDTADLNGLQKRPVVEVSLVFSDNAKIQRLNKKFRRKDNPTNVLSFPDTVLAVPELEEAALTDEPLILGDIIFGVETIEGEATLQNKKIKDHVMHLLVHGLLHLVGYDHIEQNEAEIMEELEISILQSFHISNPYLVSDNKIGKT